MEKNNCCKIWNMIYKWLSSHCINQTNIDSMKYSEIEKNYPMPNVIGSRTARNTQSGTAQ